MQSIEDYPIYSQPFLVSGVLKKEYESYWRRRDTYVNTLYLQYLSQQFFMTVFNLNSDITITSGQIVRSRCEVWYF